MSCNTGMDVCVGRVLISNKDMGVSGWVLASNGDMGVCLLGAGQQWRHGCVLGGC